MKHFFFFLLCLNPFSLSAQICEGLLLDADTNKPIAYANIGLPGKAHGTVSAEDGTFQLDLKGHSDMDSLKISMIAYKPLVFDLASFKSTCADKAIWYMQGLEYALEEVVVLPVDYVEKSVGNKIKSKAMQAGLENNRLGYEFGTLMKNKKRAFLKKVYINFSACEYDSVFLRMNVYEMNKKIPGRNLLSRPIYLSYSKEEVLAGLEIDLEEEYIMMEGHFLVTVELVRELGIKGLYLSAGLFNNKTYYRKTSQADWETIGVGVGISALILREK